MQASNSPVRAKENSPIKRRSHAMTSNRFWGAVVPSITEALQSKVRPVVEKMIQWSEGESRFLDRLLDDGELEPEHVADDLEIQERISRQPMLRWKQKHVRQHKGLDPPGRPN